MIREEIKQKERGNGYGQKDWMDRREAMEERKQNIIAMLMSIYNEERIRMIETFLTLTLKREQQENKKD